MRGWLILDGLMTLTGLVSMASERQVLSSAVGLTVLGLVLLTLTVAARIVRGRG